MKSPSLVPEISIEHKPDHVVVGVGDFTQLMVFNGMLGVFRQDILRKQEVDTDTLERVEQLREKVLEDVSKTREGLLSTEKPYTYELAVEEEPLIIRALKLVKDEEKDIDSLPVSDGAYEWLYSANVPGPTKARRDPDLPAHYNLYANVEQQESSTK